MVTRAIRAGILLLAMLLAAPGARADIYTWVDASGTLNVSNLAPPSGVHVIDVVVHHDPPPVPPAPPNAALDAARDAELQALNARVEALRDEVDQAHRRLAAQADDWSATPPAQEPVYDTGDPSGYGYDTGAVTQASVGCDPSWWGCAFGYPYGLYGYPVVIVAANARNVRRGHGVHPAPVRPPHPGHAPGPQPHSMGTPHSMGQPPRAMGSATQGMAPPPRAAGVPIYATGAPPQSVHPSPSPPARMLAMSRHP
ncbi:MAG TPA: DUF4124 domain-containing protein [Casimicrobiaceae bacterium]|nr:DUF4124 domain-containing protein [Casimicrobiaceae bacterium]